MAVKYLQTALKEEKNVTAMFNLAVIYDETGDRAKSREMYE